MTPNPSNDREIVLSRHKQNIERLYGSPDFAELERQLSVNNARFQNLRPSTRLLAAYLFRENLLESISDSWRLFYKRQVPKIEEYLTEKYIGGTAEMLYPVWRKDLTDFFQPGSAKYELVLGGAIGTGKSTAGLLAKSYNFFKINSLIAPQRTLNVTPSTVLLAALFSVTLDKAALALITPFKSLLLDGKFYVQVAKELEFPEAEAQGLIPFVQRGGTLYFPNNIIANIGSNVSHSISFSMISAHLDEAEFGGPVEKVFEVYTNLKERVRSRFLGSRFTLLTLVSSARYAHGVIAKYTQGLAKSDPHTTYLGYPIWAAKTFNFDVKGYFYVMRGTASHPSKILTATEQEIYEAGKFKTPPNCEVIQAPNNYRKDFDDRVEEALRNLAGLQTVGVEKPFDDLDQLESVNLAPEMWIEAPLGIELPLIDKFKSIFKESIDGLILRRHPTANRYLHLDLAETAEVGMGMCHKELCPKTNRIMLIYDFVCWVTAATRIDLMAIAQLVLDLANKGKVNFHTVSADQFQSSMMRQMFETSKVATQVELISVDKTVQPYMFVSRMVNNHQVKTGKAPKLKEQMTEVSIDDSRAAKKIYSSIRKDMADALVGSGTTAMNNLNDIPTVYWSDEDTVERKRAELMNTGEIVI